MPKPLPYRLYNEDCRLTCLKLNRNSIDTVITDPPYGLLFKGWDHSVPGVEFWKRILRVAKPGGMLLAFGGTRTSYRLVCAIEDAGWEIRDSLMWLYGCLSEDTEVLTPDGWEHYNRVNGKTILTYDVQSDVYAWEIPQRWSTYRVESDTAYRIQSDYTDQIVSRNHRCLVERDGSLVFVAAEECFAVERVPALPDDFHQLPHANTAILQQKMQRLLSRKRLGQARTQGVCGGNNGRKGIGYSENDGLEESGMEGWPDLLQAEGQVCQPVNQVCSVSAGVFNDGTEGRLRDGTSPVGGEGYQPAIVLGGMCTPRQPRRNGQSDREPSAVCLKCRPQATRARTSYHATLTTVTPFIYTGMIFCPTVSTGAFVARRNGKIFVTGNSGFPKSLNISKAIDKAAGAEREVVGEGISGKTAIWQDGGDMGDFNITAPATDAAKLWDGWGTSLKPAHEPVILCTKPLPQSSDWCMILAELSIFLFSEEVLCQRLNVSVNAARLLSRSILPLSVKAAESSVLASAKTNCLARTELARLAEKCSTLKSQELKGVSQRIAASGVAIPQEVEKVLPMAIGLAEDSCEGMVELLLESTENIGLNTALLWRNILADLWNRMRTFTTETAMCLTTELKILKLLVTQSISLSDTQPNAIQASGKQLNVMVVDGLLRSVLTKSLLPDATSVPGNASFPISRLTPAYETICLAMKPLAGTFAQNAIEHGVAGLNIDGSRIGTEDSLNGGTYSSAEVKTDCTNSMNPGLLNSCGRVFVPPSGRWPANLILDEEAGVLLDEQQERVSRFFYTAKAGKKERGKDNKHPTVKPLKLMEYLCTLTKTPTGGIVFDPFMGSGSTGVACANTGRKFIGCENDTEHGYFDIAKERIRNAYRNACKA